MKISYNWLKSIIELNESPEEVAALLTSSGLEVENIEKWESFKGGMKGLVSGKVLECTKHPDADRLSCTKVDVGNAVLDIVCGAPNVAKGQNVIVATVGTLLYPTEGEPFEIKKSKIRGQLSEGMICAEDEIGVGKSHSGIIVLNEDILPGTPASEIYSVETDYIFEIGITPNRTDALGHLGVARELKALFKVRKNQERKLKYNVDEIISTKKDNLKVYNDANDACKMYCGIVIKNIKLKESPEWLKNKLNSIGLRSINTLVDVTNFVMYETGHPLHAFDYNTIGGNQIKVRKAIKGEKLKLLDGKEISLTENDLVIADDTKAMCLAGIYGGWDSGVKDNTTSVFIESALFDSVSIRKSSKYHGLKTDSSFRFERGADAETVMLALKKATSLVIDLCEAEIASEVYLLQNQEIKRNKISTSVQYLNGITGIDLNTDQVKNICQTMEIETEIIGENIVAEIPCSKTEVTRPADLAEEILRIYGYDNVQMPENFSFSNENKLDEKDIKLKQTVMEFLSSNGFNEVMNISMQSFDVQQKLNNLQNSIALSNPLSSELNVLRNNMLQGILQTINYNNNRKNENLLMYEFGKIYFSDNGQYKEKQMLVLAGTGKVKEENWQKENYDADFYFIKSFAEKILSKLKLDQSKITLDFSNGRVLFHYEKEMIASVNEVNEEQKKLFDIKVNIAYAEIEWEKITLLKKQHITYKEVTKYPEVKRDLALLVDKNVTYEQLKKVAFGAERKTLKSVNIFDVYEGKNIESNKKSYALSFILLDENATLTDDKISKSMERIQQAIEKETGAEIRK